MLQKLCWKHRFSRPVTHDGPVDAALEASLEASLKAVEAAVCYGVITSHGFLSVPQSVMNANVQRAIMFSKA